MCAWAVLLLFGLRTASFGGLQATAGQHLVEKPRWAMGDTWVVQTSTQQIQAGRGGQVPAKRQLAEWEFRVEAIEVLDGQMCQRVSVRCVSPARTEPVAVFWVNEKSGRLRQVQTQLPTSGKIRTAVERYDSESSDGAVICLLSVVPLSLPSFSATSESSAVSQYRVYGAAAGSKDPGLIGFGSKITQTTRQAEEAAVRGALPDSLAKSLDGQPLTEIILADGRHKIRQIWRTGDSWPAYTEHGGTESWLVRTKKGGEQ